ncbi:hypothetical protein [Mucilaginibacter polytrichastri]|uniref:Uncharacterized protein n=1 Tax=Mucilaginibacter polytrichastri TaxID=1302689 RepID=A0A1Q6A5S3_9SPHI|nr:hypothetical protein [Mucilaginibacter polytrichastri]OKS89361.1 hypothetical protein RG47T_4845 [Mucilaginibacter polytrichastri]SFS73898.1 hypothetical protein SAMN04487890_103246 [Mucilaginibacter polytrichastri]
MSIQKILSEDWSWVDDRKKPEDRGFVSCEEIYEVEYLIDLFKKHYPVKSEKEIIYAIAAGLRSIEGYKPRQQFIEIVSSKLFAREAMIG